MSNGSNLIQLWTFKDQLKKWLKKHAFFMRFFSLSFIYLLGLSSNAHKFARLQPFYTHQYVANENLGFLLQFSFSKSFPGALIVTKSQACISISIFA